MELVILLFITVFVLSYRYNTGDNVYKFFADTVANIYNNYAPYSYQEVNAKIKDIERDNYLKSLGLTILRYNNLEINKNFEGVCLDIERCLK